MIESNEHLSYLIGPKGRVSQIGSETGAAPRNGIAVFKSPHGSYRFVMLDDGEIVAALQVMHRPGVKALAANVYVAPGYRRKGLASVLAREAERAFGEVMYSADRSSAGESWVHGRKNPGLRHLTAADASAVPGYARSNPRSRSLRAPGWVS